MTYHLAVGDLIDTIGAMVGDQLWGITVNGEIRNAYMQCPICALIWHLSDGDIWTQQDYAQSWIAYFGQISMDDGPIVGAVVHAADNPFASWRWHLELSLGVIKNDLLPDDHRRPD